MKRGALVLVLILCLGLAVGATEITVWITYGGSMGQVLQNLIEEDFTPKTGIYVNYVPEMVNPQFMQKVILAYLGGDAPDVFTFDGHEVFELGVRGVLEDFRQFPDFEKAMGHMYPNLFNQASYRGATYGIPGETGWSQVFYRTDIFDSIGAEPPHTWTELHTLIPRLKARGTEAYMSGNQISTNPYAAMRNYLHFIYQYGADIYTPDGLSTNLSSSAAIEAFKTMTSLYTQHRLPMEMVQLPAFGTGDIAYLIDESWPYGLIDALHPQLQGQWAVAQMPGVVQNGQINRTVAGGSFHYLIPKGRDKGKLEASWEFVKWISSPEIQRRFQEGIYNSPERWILTFGSEESVQTAAFRDSDRAVIQTIIGSMRTPTPTVGGLLTYRYMAFAFNQVTVQGLDPEAALRRAAQESDAELKRKQQEFARFLR